MLVFCVIANFTWTEFLRGVFWLWYTTVVLELLIFQSLTKVYRVLRYVQPTVQWMWPWRQNDEERRTRCPQSLLGWSSSISSYLLGECWHLVARLWANTFLRSPVLLFFCNMFLLIMSQWFIVLLIWFWWIKFFLFHNYLWMYVFDSSQLFFYMLRSFCILQQHPENVFLLYKAFILCHCLLLLH